MNKQYIINIEDLENLPNEQKEIILNFLKEHAKPLNNNMSIKDSENGQIVEEELDSDKLINDFENSLNELIEYRNRLINGEFKKGSFIQQENLNEIRSQLDSLKKGMEELNTILGGNDKLDTIIHKTDQFETEFKKDEIEYVDFNKKRENAQEIITRKKRGNIQRNNKDTKMEEFSNDGYLKEEYKEGELQNNKSYEKELNDNIDDSLNKELDNEEKTNEEILEDEGITLKPKKPFDFSGLFQ